jgi:hypothetical protein
MKHTAVDFLINIIDQKDWINYTTEERLKVFEQAKEIEKQQTDDAYNKGFNQGYRNPNRNND